MDINTTSFSPRPPLPTLIHPSRARPLM